MGQWMGIEGFGDADELTKLNREMTRAARADSKALREAGKEGSILRGVLTGGSNKATPTLEVPKVLDAWMGTFRQRFAKFIIRQTIDSVSPDGAKLFGLG